MPKITPFSGLAIATAMPTGTFAKSTSYKAEHPEIASFPANCDWQIAKELAVEITFRLNRIAY